MVVMQDVQLLNFCCTQLEIKDVQVLLLSFLGFTLRNHDMTVLNIPSQDHLGRSFLMFLSNLYNSLVIQNAEISLTQRRPSFHKDIVFPAVINYLLQNDVRMVENLIDHWFLPCSLYNLINVLRQEVAHSNMLDLSLLLEFNEGFPHLNSSGR